MYGRNCFDNIAVGYPYHSNRCSLTQEKMNITLQGFFRKLDQGSKSGFPKIEGGQQHIASGKVLGTANVYFGGLYRCGNCYTPSCIIIVSAVVNAALEIGKCRVCI